MTDINNLSVNAIRVLAADEVQKANSGHPGLPLGCAPIAYELWGKHMNHNPKILIGQIVIVLFYLVVMVHLCFMLFYIYLVMV